MRPFAASLALLPLLLAPLSCSKSQPPAGKVVTAEQVCKETDGARVRMTGYFRYPRGMLSFCSNYGGHKTCDMALYAAPEPPPDFDVMHPQTGPEPVSTKLSVPVGGDTGEMGELPEKFSAADVKLHLPQSQTVGEGAKVTVDGKVAIVPSGGPTVPQSCYVNVDWAAGG